MLRTILENIEQGAPEWFMARMGRVTASEFSTTMASGRNGAPSKTRTAYLYKLAGEIITGNVVEGYTNTHMERGKALEQEARALYESIHGDVLQVGFIQMGEHIGYSPDGLPSGGLLEIKTRLPHLQIELLLSDKVPPEHIGQLQGGLWVAEKEWIDFMSYWPGLPPFIRRVYRDEKKITEISTSVLSFIEDLLNVVERIKKM